MPRRSWQLGVARAHPGNGHSARAREGISRHDGTTGGRKLFQTEMRFKISAAHAELFLDC